MNALYHAESSLLLLQMSIDHEVPLLFITNNVCNKLLRFKDASEVAQVCVCVPQLDCRYVAECAQVGCFENAFPSGFLVLFCVDM
jgi:hypothetical protein